MAKLTAMLAFFVVAFATAAQAQTSLGLIFDGRVEPMRQVQIANQITGRISEVHVRPGQRVEQGDVLISIERADFEIAVDAAEAALAEARARLELAEDVADRLTRLVRRGTGAEANATQSALEVEIAKAAVAGSRASLAAAKLALERTQIRAPISGVVQVSLVTPGAFVEAEGGTIVGKIVEVDPVRVAYSISYADRQRALIAAGTTSVDELFSRISLSLKLPSGATYPHTGRPIFESAALDGKTGMLTTWGEFPNPDNTLIPGLDVTVMSKVERSQKVEKAK